jgi:hypothetical protein
MRRTIVVLTILCGATRALAADKYQLFPWNASGGRGGDPGEHYSAIVLNTVSGELYGCNASLQTRPPIKVFGIGCTKGEIKEGSLPPGPGIVTYGANSRLVMPGVWKVDQINGDVTFCGAPPDSTGLTPNWYCAVTHLK